MWGTDDVRVFTAEDVASKSSKITNPPLSQ